MDELRISEEREKAASEYLFNCCEMKTVFPRRLFLQDFLFVQGTDNEIGNLLEKHGVKSFKQVYTFRDGNLPQYQATTCQVRRGEIERFLDCIHELRSKMLLMGYRDYEAACDVFFQNLQMRLPPKTDG